MRPDHPSVKIMWSEYLALIGKEQATPLPLVSYFCNNRKDTDHTAELARDGIKRATSSSLWICEFYKEPLRTVGDLEIITNWAGEACCIIRIVRYEIVLFDHITAEYAAIEGEGDGSLAYWRRMHRAFFEKEFEATPYTFSESMPIPCEEFEVVYK
ncbi:MAG: ASCH domain-containing protein [Candidatus Kapaibacterium sp.]